MSGFSLQACITNVAVTLPDHQLPLFHPHQNLMKTQLPVVPILCFAFALAGCGKSSPGTSSQSPDSASSPASQDAATTTAPPQDTAPATSTQQTATDTSLPQGTSAAPPAPTVRHFAPDGTFYVLQRLSVTTDDGILGVPAGAKVSLVEDKGTSKLVTDGKNKFEVDPSQVTNDLDVIEQMKISSLQGQPVAAVAPPSPQSLTPAAPAAPAAPRAALSQGDIERRNQVQTQLVALNQQRTSIDDQIANLKRQVATQEAIDARGQRGSIGATNIYATDKQIAQLEIDLRQVKRAISEFRKQNQADLAPE
jgi:hypothetical protein